MLEGLRKRLRPGSAGEPLSKVATTGKEMATEAVTARRTNPTLEDNPTEQNYTVGLISEYTAKKLDANGQVIEPAGTMQAWHQPDDPEVLKRMFGITVSDI